jgi:hypothetical protein
MAQSSQQGQSGQERGHERGQERGSHAQGIHPGAQGTQFTENQELAHSLKGIDFPAKREEIVNYARSNGAPDNIIGRLNELPDEEYGNVAQVMELVGGKR